MDITLIHQIEKTRAALLELSSMLHDYPDKQEEARGAADILSDWIENLHA